jgi:hypothetical protein
VAQEIDMRGQAAACSNPDISPDTILTKRLICLVRAIRGHKP